MADTLKIKVCGVTTRAAANAVTSAGAHYVGCVFTPYCANRIDLDSAALVTEGLQPEVNKVAVVDEPGPKLIKQIAEKFRPDYIQFNGNESVEFLRTMKDKFKFKLIKTLSLGTESDLSQVSTYEEVSDILLLQPTANYLDPYNEGQIFFDWNMLKGLHIKKEWMISGNISKYNLRHIIHASHAKIVNVSHAFGSYPGIKDFDSLVEFIKIASKIYIAH